MSWNQGVKLKEDLSKNFIRIMENRKEANNCVFEGIAWYPEDIKNNEFVAMYSKDGKWSHNIRYKTKK